MAPTVLRESAIAVTMPLKSPPTRVMSDAAIANLPVLRAHILTRLRHQAQASGDPLLAALLAELRTLGSPDGQVEEVDGIAVPVELDTAAGRLSFITTTTVFGTPAEVTLSELSIEAFYPADEATAARLAQLMK